MLGLQSPVPMKATRANEGHPCLSKLPVPALTTSSTETTAREQLHHTSQGCMQKILPEGGGDGREFIGLYYGGKEENLSVFIMGGRKRIYRSLLWGEGREFIGLYYGLTQHFI